MIIPPRKGLIPLESFSLPVQKDNLVCSPGSNALKRDSPPDNSTDSGNLLVLAK